MRGKAVAITVLAAAAGPLAFWVLPLRSSDFAYWTTDVAARVVAPLLCLSLLLRTRGASLANLGLDWPYGNTRSVVRFLLTSALCTSIAFLYGFIANTVRIDILGAVDAVPESIESFRGLTPISIAYSAVASGFFEEVVFRGMLAYALIDSSRLLQRLSFPPVSALLFAAAHSSGDLAINVGYAYFGFVTALLYLWLRNLWPLITAHTLTNLIVLSGVMDSFE